MDYKIHHRPVPVLLAHAASTSTPDQTNKMKTLYVVYIYKSNKLGQFFRFLNWAKKFPTDLWKFYSLTLPPLTYLLTLSLYLRDTSRPQFYIQSALDQK